MMPDRSNEMDYDAVLYETHQFLVALPPHWWQQRPSDTPLRTIRTIIHHMAKIKGSAILHHLNKIPNHSELHSYLIRILKTMGNASTTQPTKAELPTVKDSTKEEPTVNGERIVVSVFFMV